jgi:(2Fe-2S) ferredoxin
MRKSLLDPCCEKCWHSPERPCPDLPSCSVGGPLCHESKRCKAARRERAARVRREQLDRPVVFVGTGTCGLGAGAAKTLAAIRLYLDEKKVDAEVVEVGCLGLCSLEPLVEVQLPGRTRVCCEAVTEKKAPALLTTLLAGEPPAGGVLGQHRGPGLEPWPGVRFLDEHPFFAPQTRWVLRNCGLIDPGSMDECVARGGYTALAKVLAGMAPLEVCRVVERSGLRGRGGGGFPTGKKWTIAHGQGGDQKYLICNADEGDPGAFMDRAVIEGDPHRLLEGMAIAAYAIRASKAYVYIRAEYPLAITRLGQAIAQKQPADQKYMVCNADEGDPGAFMDRAVIEGDPHRVLE